MPVFTAREADMTRHDIHKNSGSKKASIHSSKMYPGPVGHRAAKLALRTGSLVVVAQHDRPTGHSPQSKFRERPNRNKLAELNAPVASIGGAGTFDGIFFTGIIAVLIASIRGHHQHDKNRMLSAGG